MRKRNLVLLAVVFSVSLGCRSTDSFSDHSENDIQYDSEADQLLLSGESPDPIIHTEVVPPELVLVMSDPIPYGLDNHMQLIVVARSNIGAGERWTFVVPTAMGIKYGDVVARHKLCYRAYETFGDGIRPGKGSYNACTDVIVPFGKKQ